VGVKPEKKLDTLTGIAACISYENFDVIRGSDEVIRHHGSTIANQHIDLHEI